MMAPDKPIADAAARGDEILEFVSTYVDSLSDELWPVNITIHNNPELYAVTNLLPMKPLQRS
jgi:hypothetical protein